MTQKEIHDQLILDVVGIDGGNTAVIHMTVIAENGNWIPAPIWNSLHILSKEYAQRGSVINGKDAILTRFVFSITLAEYLIELFEPDPKAIIYPLEDWVNMQKGARE